MTSDSDNHRRWPRIDLKAEAIIRFDRIGSEVKALITNASERGMFLAMKEPKPVGTPIRINLYIVENRSQIQVNGVIVHVVKTGKADRKRPVGVGIYLTESNAGWSDFCAALAQTEDTQPGHAKL